MALSTFKLYDGPRDTRRNRARFYVAVPSATAGQGYNATNGETLDFTVATNPKGASRRLPPGKPLPTEDDIAIEKQPNGFFCEIRQASASPTLKNFVLRIFRLSTGVELTTADYPAGIAGRDIVFSVTTNKKDG